MGSTYRPADVCAMALGADGDRWGEPYVAAHATRAGLFAVAVQGEAKQGACSDGYQTCLFLTENGGRTWSKMAVGDLGADPLVEFQGDKLHVAALDWPGKIRLYTSTDLGKTWAGKVIVTRDGTDRPWMNVHGDELMFVWQTAGKQEGWWRLSRDAGRTWGEIGELPCNLQTQPHWAGGWIVACSGQRGTEVYRLGKDADRIDTLPSGSGTRIMSQSPDGTLWLTMPGPARAFAGASPTDWTSDIELTDRAYGNDWIHWAEAPHTGGLLALVQAGDVDCILKCDGGNGLPTRLVHVGADGEWVGEWEVEPAGRISGRPVSAAGDKHAGEFGGIACQQHTCLVAWMIPGGVDMAWFKPTTSLN